MRVEVLQIKQEQNTVTPKTLRMQDKCGKFITKVNNSVGGLGIDIFPSSLNK